MVVVKPFKAIRPEEALVDKIASLPYDVLNSEEAYLIAKNNPYSYLHIDKAEINLPQSVNPYDKQVYQTAKEQLQLFRDNHWLIEDFQDSYYLYELTYEGRSQTGIVTCTSVDDYLDNKIKKHEHTRLEKEIDRINHVDTCDANTSPIFLTYKDDTTIQTLVDEWKIHHTPIYDFSSFYDVQHRVWAIDDPTTIQKITTLFEKNVSSLYIADGHHRTESAVTVAQQRRKQYPDYTGNEPFNYFLSVIFPKDELEILDYNRVLNVPIPDHFTEQLAVHFHVTPLEVTTYQPSQKGQFGLYVNKQWFKLEAKSEKEKTTFVDQLDAARLQRNVFEDIFAIQDIRTDKRIDFVGGIRGIQELVDLVDSGQFTLAFSLYPPSMDDLLAVADDNAVMPPKSTWFEPKLLSGLFLHDLSSQK